MTRHLHFGSEYEPLIKDFATFVVDQMLETHERRFNQRREQWESTVEVLAQNSINKELLSAIRQRLTPALVQELRESLPLVLQQDLEPKLSSTISTTLTELVGDKLAPELAAAISSLLQSELRLSLASEFKSQDFSAILPTLRQISSRQLQQQVYLKRISWLLGILTASFFVFGASSIVNHYFPQVFNQQTQDSASNRSFPFFSRHF